MLRYRAVIAIRPWAITRETSVLIAVASVMLGSTVCLTLAKLCPEPLPADVSATGAPPLVGLSLSVRASIRVTK